MIHWSPKMPLPDPDLAANVVYQLCGNDNRGGEIANKIIAVLIHEVYVKQGHLWSVRSAATRFGYTAQTYIETYNKYGKRPYVRVLAARVVEDLESEMKSQEKGESPVSTTGNPYRDATRQALKGNLGKAV